jgi:hypothetical protein
MMSVGGYGQVGLGRCNFGQAKAEYEPRFYSSNPVDGSLAVSAFNYSIRFILYGFASRVQTDDSLHIEISENGGVSYVDAYMSGSFIVPYNGANSLLDAHQGNSQHLMMRLHRTSPWVFDNEVRVRITARDEFGNESTKETVVEW